MKFYSFEFYQSLTSELYIDYVISLGCACRPAYHLQQNKLRICSNPFDWMMNYTLETIIDLLNNFNNFFKNRKEDFEKSLYYRYVTDLNSGMVSMHSFPKNIEMDSYYTTFYNTMLYRYNRMKNYMKNSDKILFISNRNEPFSNFEEFLFLVSTYCKNKIYYINIFNDKKEQYEFIKLNKEIYFYQITFNDIHPDGDYIQNPSYWIGNKEKWDELLKHITLTKMFDNSDILNATKEEDKQQM